MNPLPHDPQREQFAARIARLRPEARSLDATATFYQAGYAAGLAAADLAPANQRSSTHRLRLFVAAAVCLLMSNFAAYRWGNHEGYIAASAKPAPTTNLANTSPTFPSSTESNAFANAVEDNPTSPAIPSVIVAPQLAVTLPKLPFRPFAGIGATPNVIQQAKLHAQSLSQLSRHGDLAQPLSLANVERVAPLNSNTDAEAVPAPEYTPRSRMNDLRQLLDTY